MPRSIWTMKKRTPVDAANVFAGALFLLIPLVFSAGPASATVVVVVGAAVVVVVAGAMVVVVVVVVATVVSVADPPASAASSLPQAAATRARTPITSHARLIIRSPDWVCCTSYPRTKPTGSR